MELAIYEVEVTDRDTNEELGSFLVTASSHERAEAAVRGKRWPVPDEEIEVLVMWAGEA